MQKNQPILNDTFSLSLGLWMSRVGASGSIGPNGLYYIFGGYTGEVYQNDLYSVNPMTGFAIRKKKKKKKSLKLVC